MGLENRSEFEKWVPVSLAGPKGGNGELPELGVLHKTAVVAWT